MFPQKFSRFFHVSLFSLAALSLTGVASAQNTNPQPAPQPAPLAPADPVLEPAPVPEQPIAPAPAPHATPPATYAEPAAPAGAPPAPVGPPQVNPRKREGMVPVLRLGFLVGGSGEFDGSCKGALCGEDSSSLDYDDVSGPALISADLLFHIAPEFRLGPGLMFLPTTKTEPDKSDDDFELGKEVAIMLVGEGIIDMSPAVSLILRGFVGADMLIAGGDLQDNIDDCKDPDKRPPGANCDQKEGPFVGATYGVSVGVLFPLETIGLRAELMYQAYSVEYNDLDISFDGSSDNAKITASASGSRTFIMGGIEF